MSKIHALCIVKNEADVLRETLEAATWADHIYVFDNGSTDGTWELVKSMASERIVPFKQDPAPFTDSLREEIFHAYKDRAKPGDWWCRLDADEFYIDDPRVFLAKVGPEHQQVFTASFSYYLTDKDVQAWERDPQAFSSTPVRDRLKHYVNHWSEQRFHRHGDFKAWRWGWPHEGKAYPVRIWVRHYAYRSPEQITQRLKTRKGVDAFVHERIKDWSSAVANVKTTRAGFSVTGAEFDGADWHTRIIPAEALDFDDGRLVVNEALMPEVPVARTLCERIGRKLRRLLGR